MTTEIKIVVSTTVDEAERRVNSILAEYEAKGYEAQVLNLTAVTPQEKVYWRFVLMFTLQEVKWGPPVESQQ